jgi:hypothetical protein
MTAPMATLAKSPALTLKIRSRKFVVADYAEASRIYEAAWQAELDRGGVLRGATIHEGNRLVARVSQNGRIWPPEEWTPGMVPLFDNRAAA